MPATKPKKEKTASTPVEELQPSLVQDIRAEMIPLAAIVMSGRNSRSKPGDIEELAASIKGAGRILQPLSVRLMPDQRYELIFGHRRLAAAQLLRMEAVPCVIEECDDDQADDWRAIENLQREGLNPIEEGLDCKRMVENRIA